MSANEIKVINFENTASDPLPEACCSFPVVPCDSKKIVPKAALLNNSKSWP
jgi:hypothetical protein